MPPREQILCKMCGQLGEASREDVIPRWVRKALGVSSRVTVSIDGDPGWTREREHLLVKTDKTVCDSCNHGWMKDLEDEVASVLKPMLINERKTVLSSAQQGALARWAVLKALLIEVAYREQYGDRRRSTGYWPSEPELAWLASKTVPPPYSQAWIAPFDAENRLATTHQAHRLAYLESDPPIAAHITTLTIGYVLFQVFTINFVSAEKSGVPRNVLSPPAPLGIVLRSIWPTSPDMAWPGEAYVDMAALQMVRDWTISSQ